MHRPAATMHSPSPALDACIMAGIERDTRGCALTDAERFNYFPATPLAVISWIFEGTLHMVDPPGPNTQRALGPALPRLVFSGPQRHPSASWFQGAVRVLSVGFYPEALSHLIGRSIGAYLDQNLPLEAVAPPALLQTCQAVLDTGGDDAFAILEKRLQPLWLRPSQACPTLSFSDWSQSMATSVAQSAAGQSLRQLQRRVRDRTGQSYRDLQRFIRVEEAFIRQIKAERSGTPNLAAIAADAGFADQSHMGREIRKVTGLSPGRLGERMASDETFWYYRLVAGKLGRQQ